MATPVDEDGGLGHQILGVARAGRAAATELGPGVAEPGGKGVAGGLAQRDDALLGALAPHREAAAPEVDVGAAEAAQLGDPQAAAVEHLEHGVVAAAEGELGGSSATAGVGAISEGSRWRTSSRVRTCGSLESPFGAERPSVGSTGTRPERTSQWK